LAPRLGLLARALALVVDVLALALLVVVVAVALGPVELEDVALKVLRAERERVARVDDLDDEVGTLERAPQLAPNLEVALERRKEERLVVLQAARERSRVSLLRRRAGKRERRRTHSASPRLHSRKASRSCLSSSTVVMSRVHAGRRGTWRRWLLADCLLRSSASC